MAATSIFFNGRIISVPGSYSTVDSSGLEQVGLGASGIVAVLGTAVGGKPASDMAEAADFHRILKPESGRSLFRSGDLREVMGILFEPAKDADILAGAQEVVAMKVNPATQSSATLSNAVADAITLTSEDYGAFTEQLNADVQSGTNDGKLLTLIFEDVTDSVDDLGGDNIFTLVYDEAGAIGWDTVGGRVEGGDVVVDGTRVEANLSVDIVVQLAAAGTVQIHSSQAADTTQTLKVFGVDGSDNILTEEIAFNGTTIVAGLVSFTEVYGARASAVLTGNWTLEAVAAPASDIFVEADRYGGMVPAGGMYVANSRVVLTASGAETGVAIVEGKTAAGAIVTEAVTMNGAAGVKTTNSFSEITAIVTAALGTTTTISGEAAHSSSSVQDTIQKVVDYFNARNTSGVGGFTAVLVTGNTAFLPGNLDWTSNTSIKTTAVGFLADLWTMIDWINNNTELATAVKAQTGAAAAGSITCVVGASLVDTQVTVVNDGINAAVTFEFDSNASVTETATTRAVVFTAGDSAATIATAIATAINSAPALNITAVASSGVVTLTNTRKTALGNQTITETVVNAGYVVAGMSGGITDPGTVPSNTAAPVFFAGGTEGTASFADWQNALNLLKKARINTVVVLTPNAAVHAAQDAHCAYMGGIGRSERDTVAGIMNAAETGLATKTEVKSQIIALNSRHTRVWAQRIERFNTSGAKEVFEPYFGAAMIAGMQAGSAVGTSLTYKYMNALNLTQDTSWNPTDDAEEMIKAGLIFGETVDGIGRRVVRNITSYLVDSNISRIEASVNEAVNFAVFTFRTNLEFAVGKAGFAGTINATKGIAINTLGLLTAASTITGWRALDIDLVVDILNVGVEMAPVIPINFVKTNVHLVTLAQAQAA